MTRDYNPLNDLNNRVDDIPPTIRAKITEFYNAAQDYAFIGSKMPEEHRDVETQMGMAFYNLQRTIKTVLDRVEKPAPVSPDTHMRWRPDYCYDLAPDTPCDILYVSPTVPQKVFRAMDVVLVTNTVPCLGETDWFCDKDTDRMVCPMTNMIGWAHDEQATLPKYIQSVAETRQKELAKKTETPDNT